MWPKSESSSVGRRAGLAAGIAAAAAGRRVLPGGVGAAEGGQGGRDRPDLRAVGAAGTADPDGRRDGGRRDQPEGRHQGARRRAPQARGRRRWRLRREGEERRAAADRAGARPRRRHRRVAQHLHARGDRGDRARADPVAHALLRRQHHRPRLQVRLPDLAGREPAVLRRGAGDPRARQGGHREGAVDGRHHRRQLGLARLLPQADARGRAGEDGDQGRDGRDLHPAAVGCDSAHPEGALDAPRDPALHLLDDLRPEARAGEDERVPARQGRGAGDRQRRAHGRAGSAEERAGRTSSRA